MGMIQVLSSETNRVVYSLNETTTVYRYEPRDVSTPMTPHSSPYAPYGRYEFGYKHLFCAEERALADLTQLRDSQGYFEGDVTLRSAVLGPLLRRCGSGTVLLVDIKFNISVLGAGRRGGLIVATPTHRTGDRGHLRR